MKLPQSWSIVYTEKTIGVVTFFNLSSVYFKIQHVFLFVSFLEFLQQCHIAGIHYSCVNWNTKYYLYPHGIIPSCCTYAMDFEPKCFPFYLVFIFNLNQVILVGIVSITESVLCFFIITAFMQYLTALKYSWFKINVHLFK